MRFFALDVDEPEMRGDLRAAFERVLDGGRLILGPEVAAFEAEFAAACGAAHAVGVGNGLDALVLALRAAGIGAGDEVVVPAHTYAATWLAVTAVGALPVPAAVDEATFVLTAEAAAAAVTSRTAAILPVSLYGHPVDMPALMALAARHGLFVLEDAAQSHGSAWDGVPTGSAAHATAFSFYPTKNLGALGDGGALVTGDAALAGTVRTLRNYGMGRRYEFEMAGINSRLDELQAAFLRVRLPRLAAANDRRRALARRYDALLAGLDGATLPMAAERARHVHHLYVVRVAERARVQRALADAGVETLVHYPVPCHRQPAFAGLDLRPDALPQADAMAASVLSLPLRPTMADGDPAIVADALKAAL